ncbi:hypothetical protein C8J56DRAFT_915638 [Mycena floridula]|nr:hypothetical protein C8J56DRAFT_915638 [Mycena floridula]
MTNTATNAHRTVVPSEVGWQFVPQYYTFVNKQPDRLHLFYNKNSTFIHGTEGEDGQACHGQQEIHQKITSLGFSDCKVFIHSVDAQSSADGGIVIQVIGEMSNASEEWRKFVQTFFLAEQPNGYFVLNDIFRFLKEEAVDNDDADQDQAPQVEAPESVPTPIRTPEPPREPTPPPPVMPIAEPEPEISVEEPTTVAEIPASPIQVSAPVPLPASGSRPNGVHSHEPEKQPTPAPVEPIVQIEKAKSPAPPAPVAAPTPPPPVAAVAPAPAPAQPPAPKTWANLAATNPKKWGSAVAQESRGTSQVVPPSPSSIQNPTSAAPAGAQASRPPAPGARPLHPAVLAAQSVSTPQAFVKGVTEPVTETMLTSYLTSRFGPISAVDIVRSKACAFLDFSTVEAARRAIVASLPQPQGGEGGLFIDTQGPEGQIRVVVETRKERADRPVSRPRGGAPPMGGGEANARGGSNAGGSNFRGRGRGRGMGTK